MTKEPASSFPVWYRATLTPSGFAMETMVAVASLQTPGHTGQTILLCKPDNVRSGMNFAEKAVPGESSLQPTGWYSSRELASKAAIREADDVIRGHQEAIKWMEKQKALLIEWAKKDATE